MPTVSIRAVADFIAPTFQIARYLIKYNSGSSLHPNRYCFYTLLPAFIFSFRGFVKSVVTSPIYNIFNFIFR